MYIVTGAAGFIASCVAIDLHKDGLGPLVLVDDFSRESKAGNWEYLKDAQCIDRAVFIDWLKGKEHEVKAIIHLGARTDTAEKDRSIFEELNIQYSKDIWNWCALHEIPMIYASSAATYGGGEFGFDDDHQTISDLKPLNPYGESKQVFDMWALAQPKKPPFWAGLKFFNVFGPNEFHKGRMASVIFHAFNQIKNNGKLKLFRSHRADYENGAQIRDFIYVKDLVRVIRFLLDQRPESAIYNLGTGKARTFLDLGKAVFKALDHEVDIEFIDTPIDIRDTYQYFTEAKMEKLLNAGYSGGFTSLEEAVEDYVQNYLAPHNYYRG